MFGEWFNFHSFVLFLRFTDMRKGVKTGACPNMELRLLRGDSERVAPESESRQGPISSAGRCPPTFLPHQPRPRLSCRPPTGPIDRGRFLDVSSSLTYAIYCQRTSDRSITQSFVFFNPYRWWQSEDL